MMQIGFIGIGAGAAAALLFASVTSGTMLSIPLAYLAPLPILIAGLGWSPWAAAIAALTATAGIGLFLGSVYFLAFLIGIGIPAWWLSNLTMLARPAAIAGNGASPAALEWYPPGRLVVWAAALSAAFVVFAILSLGTDADGFRTALRASITEIVRLNAAEGGPGRAAALKDPERLIELMVQTIPPGMAVLMTVTNVVNLWLAARIVNFSGRLTRPWPVLTDITFPHPVAGALALGLALSFVDGFVGIFAGVVAAALLMAYGMLGFAVLLSITQGIKSRGFVLAGVVTAVIVFRWPVLGLCLLGLIETLVNLRGRVASKRGPPARL